MIEDMIAKPLQEAAEEAMQTADCYKEISESRKLQAGKEESSAKTQSRIGKGDSSVAKLIELVSTLSEEFTEIDAAVADAIGDPGE